MESQVQAYIAVAVFLLTYALIISEKIHRTVVALLGGLLVIFLGILEQHTAIEMIDFNTLGLLTGMMIIVGITKRTGLFEFLAIKSAKWAKGEPWRLMLALATITAVGSAFLDNVTTVLLIVPVTFSITEELKINPIPFLITEIIASNVGGTATLIGDPPNIMIGSQTHLGFMDFVINLAPPVIVVYILTMVCLKFIYGRRLKVAEELKQKVMEFDENEAIKDVPLLKKCLFVLGLTILGFILHQFVHMESATIALGGGTLLMLLSKINPEHVLHEVEWPVIFFFIGLFILVGGLEETGIIEAMAVKSLEITGGEMVSTSLIILWLSAIASAFVDNIPFVATMIPLLKTMGELGGMSNIDPFWWSLALGACLGGNGTLIGASANVIVAGMAEHRKYPISFVGYMKVAFPLMIMSIIISSIYVYLRYLM
ncbi:SLC13 family permease [Phosphitispora fastidiosa]|uniref:SLC13 family permease n=1 Tax=Phosphitispora fastidiosa TaxID=2837202 RepID=UPI001E3B73EB|nr:ArsB/NhaD family transporter [Phosphitispora fastidiosa]MBU7007351.1 Na+/H+ antiporter NhaD/arsenite permease-like protein [Phosphitispora fastidiosa]